MKYNVFVLGAMLILWFCSCRPLTTGMNLDHLSNIQKISDSDTLSKTPRLENLNNRNYSRKVVVKENKFLSENVHGKVGPRFNLWQGILVFGGILLFCTVAGVIGYKVALSGKDEDAEEGEKTNELKLGPDAAHMYHFMELAQQKMAKGDKIHTRYVFFVTRR